MYFPFIHPTGFISGTDISPRIGGLSVSENSRYKNEADRLYHVHEWKRGIDRRCSLQDQCVGKLY